MKLDKTGWIRLALLFGTAALTLLALIAGLGYRLNDQAHAATTNVNVGQTNGGGGGADEYNSAAITIAEGDTVNFDWYDGFHNITAYAETVPGTPDWQSSYLDSPSTFSQTFNTAGVFTYYCTIHTDNDRDDAAPGVVDANIVSGDQMVGKVIVESAAADTPTPTDAPPTDTPTDTPVAATATPTDVPPTDTPTEGPPTETPAEATATAAPPTATATEAPAEATPTATETSEPATATPTNTPSAATATAVPPTATPTDAPPTATTMEEPASTSEPTATEEPASTPLPRTHNVEAGNEWFGGSGNQNGADEITIRAGDTVQWNIVEGVHTVYECGDAWIRANGCADAAWSSDILQTGEIFSRRFSAAGTFYYLCTLHPLTMRGVIAVEGNAAPPNAVTSTPPPPGATPTSTVNPIVSSPTPNINLPVGLANSGHGPLSQESARPDSPLGRAITIAAAAVALIAAALMLKEVAWSIRN